MESIMTVNNSGDKVWKNEKGKLHREDGPAMEGSDGYKAWYLDSKLHRENGPAVIYPDGYKAWWLNDKRHNENGPAIVYPNGNKEWWINDKEYTEKQWKEEVRKYKLSKLKL